MIALRPRIRAAFSRREFLQLLASLCAWLPAPMLLAAVPGARSEPPAALGPYLDTLLPEDESPSATQLNLEAKVMARVALERGDRAQALRYVEEILSRLEGDLKLETIYEPAWVCLACYEVLSTHKDPRAKNILDAARRLLQERAGQIDDQAVRRSFLENVAANRKIIAAWEERSHA